MFSKDSITARVQMMMSGYNSSSVLFRVFQKSCSYLKKSDIFSLLIKIYEIFQDTQETCVIQMISGTRRSVHAV